MKIYFCMTLEKRARYTQSHEEEKMVKIEINAAVAARTAKNVCTLEYTTQ